ncbi:MAG: metallophosphoesterase [Holosporales bacterium]|jgi:hypothetical protein|nr:metallophosphoesterase [Holosporales bacterium]
MGNLSKYLCGLFLFFSLLADSEAAGKKTNLHTCPIVFDRKQRDWIKPTGYESRTSPIISIHYLPEHPNVEYCDLYAVEQSAKKPYAGIIPILPPDTENPLLVNYVTTMEQVFSREELANIRGKRLVLGCADLHLGECCILERGTILDEILSSVEGIFANNPGSWFVISGDMAPRGVDEPFLEFPGVTDFLLRLNEITNEHLVVTFGNHEPQNPLRFWEFVDFLHSNNIKVITNVARWFRSTPAEKLRFRDSLGRTQKIEIPEELRQRIPDIVRSFMPFFIDGNVLFYPHCLNFMNRGETDVFTEDGLMNLSQIDRDLCCRRGVIDNLMYSTTNKALDRNGNVYEKLGADALSHIANNEGQINDVVLHMAEQFKIGLETLAQSNPDGDLIVVFAAHEYYLKLLAFWERVSQICPELRVTREILNRVKVVAVCGHEHCLYSILKTLYMTASDGERVEIPCVMGGPGMYGSGIWLADLGWTSAGELGIKLTVDEEEPAVDDGIHLILPENAGIDVL